MIDLSIVFGAGSQREHALEYEHPALGRIEYHRSPYRFSRKNRGSVAWR